MDIDSHSWVLWLGVAAVVLHVLEEYAEGWVAWANFEIGPRFGITFTEGDFFVTSFALVFIALAGAAIGWWAPAFSLAVPALFVINAVFFHMIPSARGDRLTPGTLSAVFVYLPIATWMFWAASKDGQLDFGTFVLSFVIGAAILVYPLAVLALKTKIGWDDETVAAATKERAAEAARNEELAELRAAQELRAATPPREETDPELSGESSGGLEEDLVEQPDEVPTEPAGEPEGTPDEGDDDTQVMRRN